MEKKNLLFYEKKDFSEFAAQIASTYGEVFPVTYLVDKNISLKYLSITDVEKFVLDITVLVLAVPMRPDFLLFFESWISDLNYEHKDNIQYCVEQRYIKEACELFDFYFNRIEIDKKESSCTESDPNDSTQNVEENKIKSITEYDEKEFNKLMNHIQRRLYGHDEFKKDLVDYLKSFILLYKMKRRKIFSVLLCGKSGIGKTEVGRILQDEMYPKEKSIKINFGNYSGKGSLWSLIGSPKGYVGSEQGGELSNKIKKSLSKVIIIDELDKADESIFTFFYEMLEDGQFTDLDGNVVDLSGYIVIFTANLNNKNFRDKIPEPLFSRFDMTYEFEPLSDKQIKKFVDEFADFLISDYHNNVAHINNADVLKKNITEINFTKSNNLRNIKRDIMNEFVKTVGLENIWEKQIN